MSMSPGKGKGKGSIANPSTAPAPYSRARSANILDHDLRMDSQMVNSFLVAYIRIVRYAQFIIKTIPFTYSLSMPCYPIFDHVYSVKLKHRTPFHLSTTKTTIA